ncbi:hypothetical protein ACN47E_005948 [Coniothyrium glycines]
MGLTPAQLTEVALSTTRETKHFVLPRTPTASAGLPIKAPTEEDFTSTFGKLLPPADYVDTEWGRYAYYDMNAGNNSQPTSSENPDRVLLIHGVQTPAIGMLPLARELKSNFPQTHFVLLDLWGHGLSMTPVMAHQPSLFHYQIDHLLDHLGWQSAHLIGYSFGGALTVGYVASRPERVQSFVLVAPAGLLRLSSFTKEQQALLLPSCEDEIAAQKAVVGILESGELIVPADWRERVAKGEVVAQAVKEWQMREHAGHTASVVAIFRDEGVMDNDAVFRQVADAGVQNTIVLGELDDLCSREQLNRLGFHNISVVPKAGHGVVRERESEVAHLITTFWRGLGASK